MKGYCSIFLIDLHRRLSSVSHRCVTAAPRFHQRPRGQVSDVWVDALLVQLALSPQHQLEQEGEAWLLFQALTVQDGSVELACRFLPLLRTKQLANRTGEDVLEGKQGDGTFWGVEEV